MTDSLTGFDDWLVRMLNACARGAGEDVGLYVARAVASRMVTDRARAEDGSVEELQAYLAKRGLLSTVAPELSTVITDPDRLRALYATELLDSPTEEIYDRITRAAAAALDAPSAAISLVDVDRQFFKSTIGMDVTSPEDRQTPLERSVCQYAVQSGNALVLEDARLDPVFKDHAAVRDGSVVAYLGIPLIGPDGDAIGTLCVFDDKPRSWNTAGHIETLTSFAQLAAERIFGTTSGD